MRIQSTVERLVLQQHVSHMVSRTDDLGHALYTCSLPVISNFLILPNMRTT